jgi:hypothetical protein
MSMYPELTPPKQTPLPSVFIFIFICNGQRQYRQDPTGTRQQITLHGFCQGRNSVPAAKAEEEEAGQQR